MGEKRIEDMEKAELIHVIRTLEVEKAFLQEKVSEGLRYVREIAVRRVKMGDIQSENRRLQNMLKWMVSWMEGMSLDGVYLSSHEEEMMRMARRLLGLGKD